MTARGKTPVQRLRRLAAEPVIGLRKLWLRHVVKDPRTLAYRDWKRANRGIDLRLDYALPPDPVVWDLGGYLGDFAAQVRDRFGARVWLFEPSPEFHAACETRFADTPEVRCFAFGLGASDRDMLLTDDADGSSMVDEKTGTAGGATVRIRRFADVMAEEGVERIDLLKINIEGGEFEVLPHLADAGLLPRITHLQIQFHDFVTDAPALRDAIRARLAETHDCIWCYDFVWESWQLRTAR